MNTISPTALVILDGWGYVAPNQYNAITQADPVTFNFLWENYPHAILKASGSAVGLPEGIMGNSEVGHMTIGAGSIRAQPISVISNAINDGLFFSNPALIDIFKQCLQKNGRLHLIGLLSDGYVHSSTQHLYALLQAAADYGIPHVYIHAFLDGRDTPPRSAVRYLTQLEQTLRTYTNARLGSIAGRFYAMDRDENWERTLQVYETLTAKTAVPESWHDLINHNYKQDITDEFIAPALLENDAKIRDNDTLLFFNIRPDRMRQLVSLFLHQMLPTKKDKLFALPTTPAHLTIASMVHYHKDFKTYVLYQESAAPTTLLDSLEKSHKNIFTIAETEKYAHVTYFFSGGKEALRSNETRIMIPSPAVATYDQQPEMSAALITETVLDSLKNNPADFYLINYANADMVGHTGNLNATIQAIKVLDQQIKKLYEAIVLERNGTLYITADHGNAEQMWDTEHNCPHTAHTTNPVPFIMIRNDLYDAKTQLLLTQLADITPFILQQ